MAIGFSFTGLVKYVTDIVKGLVNFNRIPLAPKESNAMLVHNEVQANLGEQDYRVVGGISSDWYEENTEFGHARGMSKNSQGFVVKQNSAVVMVANNRGLHEGMTRVYSSNNKPSPATLNAADRVHYHHELIGSNYVQGGLQKPADFGSGKLKYQMLNTPYGWSDTLWISSYTGNDVPLSNQIVIGKGNESSSNIGFRQQRFDSNTWGALHHIYNSGKDTGWRQIERLNSKFVDSTYHGFDHRWRIDNGTLYILLRGVFRTTVNGEGLGYIPNWNHGVVYLPATGYGDRGGTREGKSLAIAATGMIYLNTANNHEFSVYTGVMPIKL